jgi:glycerophosphoryl diester phosphodiesterase
MPLPWNIAHRGGAGLRPENTLTAFADAIARGCDGAELDVQLSKDNQLVVFHDFRLNPKFCRAPDGAFVASPAPKIMDLTFAELKTYDLSKPNPQSDYGVEHPDVIEPESEHIPLLADVVQLAKLSPKPFHLFVEIKTSFSDRAMSASPEAVTDAALKVLGDADYLDRAILVGFDWPALLHAKKVAPHVECWFTTLPSSWFRDGTPPPEDDPPADAALQVVRHWAQTGTSPWAGGFDAINHGHSILQAIKAAGGDGWFPSYTDATPENLAQARELGLRAGAWTVDDPAIMHRLIGEGIDAILTDRPDWLATALTETT